jgi:hypothetical protein
MRRMHIAAAALVLTSLAACQPDPAPEQPIDPPAPEQPVNPQPEPAPIDTPAQPPIDSTVIDSTATAEPTKS